MTEFNVKITVDCSDRLEKVLTALTGGCINAASIVSAPVSGEITPTNAPATDLAAPQAPKKVRRTAAKKTEENEKTETESLTEADTNAMREEEAPVEKGIKMEDLRPAMAKLWASGNKERTAQILQKHGAKLLKEVKPEEYKTLLNEFNEALHATA